MSQLHIVGGEQPVAAFADPSPPAIINHFYVGDDVIWVKGDLIITRCRESGRGSVFTQGQYSYQPTTTNHTTDTLHLPLSHQATRQWLSAKTLPHPLAGWFLPTAF